ncbi:MAG: penicillin-binding protein 2 [Actinobacteria bacterium]|nr:penicillin-binding protein 2 [Actinomycetota bacterium]
MSQPIMRLFATIVLLFAILVVGTSRWSVFDAKALRDNALNKRPLLAQLHVKRGAIKAADGSVLARSVRGQGGTYRRSYPAGSLFGHPVGYAIVALNQLAGIERYRNDELSGQAGDSLSSLADQLQGKRQQGDTVVTTLDPQAQRVATDQLAATGSPGAVVALDPRTGAVLAMASSPGYDPNGLGRSGVFRALNSAGSGAPLLDRATQSSYAPGSTFKVLTAAAAIDSGRYTPDSVINGDSPKTISGVPMRNDLGQSYGDISLTTAMTNSVNTVFGQIGEALGKRTMADYMRRFGFYRRPPLDYPADEMLASGERLNGKLLPVTSDRVDVGRMAIGQDKLAVTPMQMAMVVAAVANGGRLMTPHLTDRIVDPDGRTVKRVEPTVAGTPISPTTAAQVNQMMRTVVESGTGTAVQLPGIQVAGKTGTAEIGTLGANLTQPSFVAFAPADAPRVAIAVTVERSQGGFGGTVAAPIARAVLQSLLS